MKTVCFASYNECLADDDPQRWLGLEDKLCLLEDGHPGEHAWTPASQIQIGFEE